MGKNATVKRFNGCETIRTGMTRTSWITEQGTDQADTENSLAKAPQPRPPPIITSTPRWLIDFRGPQTAPPTPPLSRKNRFPGGPENAPFPGRGGVGGGLGQTFSRLEPSPHKRKEGLSPPSPPPLGCGHSNLSGYLSLGGGCRKTPRIDS